MTYQTFKIARDVLEAECRSAFAGIEGLNSGPSGLTPDEIKRSAAYKVARAKHAQAFAALRNLNAKWAKTFSKETKAELRQRP